ncbi:Protein TIFY 3 [Zea mays]|uniref:Protein TIFY 3 n=1 Tax=Zea mays TaxID=4577 RepID=A0A3L6EZ73_MAIZE|nr:Protein TIFY 3 [Zea mays]
MMSGVVPSSLHVLLRAERALRDRDVGEVHIPLSELLSGAPDGPVPAKFVAYQVRKISSGKPQGVLNLSYKLGEVANGYAPAPPPSPPTPSLHRPPRTRLLQARLMPTRLPPRTRLLQARPTRLQCCRCRTLQLIPHSLQFSMVDQYVYDSVPPEKAQAIMLIAAAAAAAAATKGSAATAFNPPMSTSVAARQAQVVADPSSISKLQADLPIARRHSLQRFLEKRRDRLA